jgi:hypothetical protein
VAREGGKRYSSGTGGDLGVAGAIGIASGVILLAVAAALAIWFFTRSLGAVTESEEASVHEVTTLTSQNFDMEEVVEFVSEDNPMDVPEDFMGDPLEDEFAFMNE